MFALNKTINQDNYRINLSACRTKQFTGNGSVEDLEGVK
jgi:hypothetical protein